MRRHDLLHGELEIVAVVGEVAGQQVEQVGVPRLVFHFIDRLDQAAAEESRPKPVHHRAAEAAVPRTRHRLGQLLDALGPIRLRVDCAQLRMDEPHAGNLAGRLVAPYQLQRLVGIDAGQRVGIGQRPVVDETVVAGGALEVHAHENLRDVLRRLHRRFLAGVHHAAPDDALGEAPRVFRRVYQFVHKLVVRFVAVKRAVKPAGDLLAAAVDEAGAGVVVAQDVVPKRQPMFRVRLAVIEQPADQRPAFVLRVAGDERVQFRHRRQQADGVEINAPCKKPVRNHLDSRHPVLGEVRGQDAIDRMAALVTGQLRPARREIQHRCLGKRRPLLPRKPLVYPSAHQTDLLRRQPRALFRHDIVGVNAGNQLNQVAVGALADHYRRSRVTAGEQFFTRLDAEASLGFAFAVALGAALFQQRRNLPGKTDLVLGRRRQLGRLLRRQPGLHQTNRDHQQPSAGKHISNQTVHGSPKIKPPLPLGKENELRLARLNLINLKESFFTQLGTHVFESRICIQLLRQRRAADGNCKPGSGMFVRL